MVPNPCEDGPCEGCECEQADPVANAQRVLREAAEARVAACRADIEHALEIHGCQILPVVSVHGRELKSSVVVTVK